MLRKMYKKLKAVLLADSKLLCDRKERNLINKPFEFRGTNGRAILLIHGWTSTPYEVRKLGKYLNENGFTVSAPLLRGHGTVPKDLEKVKWTDWIKDITIAYNKLKKDYSQVYVIGTSLGANLAVILAKNKPSVSGLVLMAMPYKIRIERTMVLLAKLMSLFEKYNKKFYPPTFGVSTTMTRVISYQTYPISSAFEAFIPVKISRRILPKITQPCLVIQSSSDHVVARKNLEQIYASLGSKIKEKKHIKRAYHTFISDSKNGRVFKDILDFINRN
ncbi:MAG TPA: alpha/beta fold hydrolase [Candidatus Moranbacteria bacterium]|nr:alpha/beta fold hydrolase [Candidatus Moranbacteria bacterium]